MSISRLLAGLAVCAAWAGSPTGQSSAAEPGDARLDSYENYFALSLSPRLRSMRAESNEIVVLFDTSASQSGDYRDKARAALQAFLSALAPEDRVRLWAVDVNAVEMTAGFASPAGDATKAALAKLTQRVPLGATDMDVVLQTAAESFANGAAKPRAAIYFGDGASFAGGMGPDEFRQRMKNLVARKVPFSSYAIGPRFDAPLLAAVANHTGGMVVFDHEQSKPDAVGHQLANAATETVVWPTSLRLPASFTEILPATTPPLRCDRDTVLIGAGRSDKPFEVQMEATVAGRPTKLSWSVKPTVASDDNAYLARLVEAARGDNGATLPIVGTAGLHEIRRMANEAADRLGKQAGIALALNNPQQAQRLAAGADARWGAPTGSDRAARGRSGERE